MSLTKLVLIVPSTDEEGKIILKRLDRNESVSKESIRMVKQPPRILQIESNCSLPIYVETKKGFRDKANALLIGERIQEINSDYYSASYCKI